MNFKKRPRIWLPGRIVIGIAAVFLLWSTVVGSHPRWYYMSGIVIHGFVLVFSMMAILALVFCHWSRRGESRSGWLIVTLLTALSLGLFGFEIPLRVGFLFGAKGELEKAIRMDGSGRFQRLDGDIISRFYSFSAGMTNRRLDSDLNPGRVLFIMKDDSESAFIYAPEGIEGLRYNSGNCGHLLGDWYWMKED